MIHLVNMPLATLTRPNLPLGLFKSQLAEAGIESEVFNFNFDFAQRIGFGGYETIAFFKGIETQIGEWLFAQEAWGEDFGLSEEEFLSLCGEELDNIPKIPDKKAWLQRIRSEVVPSFLESCVERLQAHGDLSVVGFSCTFFQTVSSLALGRLIKTKYPDVKVIYGGACFHGDMGDELMRKLPWIDAVSTGEADDTIIPLINALRQGRDPTGLQGILYRDAEGKVHSGPERLPVHQAVIKSLPHPDYDSFFSDAARVGLDRDEQWLVRLLVPFESSRGCWWGQMHQCTFCGLNGQGMVYRSKPGTQVYDTLHWLSARYPQAKRYQASDNILSMSYFKDLIPKLREDPLPNDVELFYSVKSNMTRQQIKALADAGIKYLQPGIESLSTHILQLMNKGVTGLQNLFLLKCCREYGIVPYWNNLIRVPGEKGADYALMEEWIPKIHHLRPPYGGARKIECHRFSPYYHQTGRWIDNIRPQAWYAGIFPPDLIDLERVAYYFDADWKDVLGGSSYDGVIRATLEWIRVWKEESELPQLKIRPRNNACIDIVDTRRGEAGLWQLDALETAVYFAIDAPASVEKVRNMARARVDFKGAEQSVQRILDDFEQAGIALQENSKYLAIALAEETVDPPLELRRRRLKHSINNQRSK